MQDHPTGTPSPSPPCLDKLDVPQLQQDIPKWIPWLSESSQRQWKTFMEQDLRCLQAMPAECDVPWILPDLIFQAGQRNQVSRPVLQFEDIFEEERIESNVSNRKRHATRTYMANRKHIRYAVYTPHLDFQVFTNLKILRLKEFYTTHKRMARILLSTHVALLCMFQPARQLLGSRRHDYVNPNERQIIVPIINYVIA